LATAEGALFAYECRLASKCCCGTTIQLRRIGDGPQADKNDGQTLRKPRVFNSNKWLADRQQTNFTLLVTTENLTVTVE